MISKPYHPLWKINFLILEKLGVSYNKLFSSRSLFVISFFTIATLSLTLMILKNIIVGWFFHSRLDKTAFYLISKYFDTLVFSNVLSLYALIVQAHIILSCAWPDSWNSLAQCFRDAGILKISPWSSLIKISSIFNKYFKEV